MLKNYTCCWFAILICSKNLRPSPYKDHSHDCIGRLANWHLLLAGQNRHSSEQGIHLNAHSEKVTTHHLCVIKPLDSRLYLLLEISQPCKTKTTRQMTRVIIISLTSLLLMIDILLLVSSKRMIHDGLSAKIDKPTDAADTHALNEIMNVCGKKSF